jgi:hypothetical protein
MCVLALNIVARFLPSKTTLSASLPFRAGQSWSDPPGGVDGVSFRDLVEDGLEGVVEIFEERDFVVSNRLTGEREYWAFAAKARHRNFGGTL